MKIDILNPKATKLLEDLAEMKLIAIRDYSPSDFLAVLKKLRAKSKSAPDFDEITREVELVRKSRYGR